MSSQFSPNAIQITVYGCHLLKCLRAATSTDELDKLAYSVRRFTTVCNKYQEVPSLHVKVLAVFNTRYNELLREHWKGFTDGG